MMRVSNINVSSLLTAHAISATSRKPLGPYMEVRACGHIFYVEVYLELLRERLT